MWIICADSDCQKLFVCECNYLFLCRHIDGNHKLIRWKMIIHAGKCVYMLIPNGMPHDMRGVVV
jgi:hypothetical protein